MEERGGKREREVMRRKLWWEPTYRDSTESSRSRPLCHSLYVDDESDFQDVWKRSGRYGADGARKGGGVAERGLGKEGKFGIRIICNAV